jgi:hypothetical protein
MGAEFIGSGLKNPEIKKIESASRKRLPMAV